MSLERRTYLISTILSYAFALQIASLFLFIYTMPLKNRGSMARVIPAIQRRLTAATLVLYLLFTMIVAWRMLFSSFRLGK